MNALQDVVPSLLCVVASLLGQNSPGAEPRGSVLIFYVPEVLLGQVLEPFHRDRSVFEEFSEDVYFITNGSFDDSLPSWCANFVSFMLNPVVDCFHWVVSALYV